MKHSRATRAPHHTLTIGNRITCPHCGNDRDFFELANDVVLTTFYSQNSDGSFSKENSSTEINGDMLLFCGACQEELSCYHQRFREMIF